MEPANSRGYTTCGTRSPYTVCSHGIASNANVQDLLPSLSTHLGHLNLSSTERYLTMTPELLTEASLRFEKYMLEGCDA